ncbi:MAG: hypothetical protein JW704_10055 [Anaerolineaceae bacterium]|nr:hypothetical protein [Anaerolineaceae bacterium]MBN2677095.1 hypothetical protein [Anaerolineaceae bacterium]
MIQEHKLPELLTIDSMPPVDGLAVPDFFFLVIKKPAPLAGMCQPTSTTPWNWLFKIGLQQVICLTERPPAYIPDPLQIAGHFPLQDLYHGKSPIDHEAEKEKVYQASYLVKDLIIQQIGVLVHCIGGIGRTGTVIGCTLRGLGYNSPQVLSYLDRLNRLRGTRNGWPESEWQTEVILQFPVNRSDPSSVSR